MGIITISREFGSGGREVGKRLADQLGFAYYDKEILTAVAKESGLDREYIERIMEQGEPKHYPVTFGRTFSSHSSVQQQRSKMEILIKQHQILKELAQNGDCVIVGRGADVILSEFHPFNLFVYASMPSKISRCRKYADAHENLTERELKAKIRQIDRSRKQYYEFLEEGEWGAKEKYHLCVNTTGIEIKQIIPALSQYIQSCYEMSGGNEK